MVVVVVVVVTATGVDVAETGMAGIGMEMVVVGDTLRFLAV